MKKSTKAVLGALGAAAVGNAVHAAVYRPKKADIAPLPQETVDVDSYRRHLSEAIQFRTVSYRDYERVDWNEFEKFHKFLDEAYPLIKENLEKEIVPPANLKCHHDKIGIL